MQLYIICNYIMNFNFEDKKYNLHIVDNFNYNEYIDFFNNQFICDTNYISQNYEFLMYSILEDPGCVGFFISNKENKIIYLSLIVDIDCVQSDNINVDESNSIIISLLCSNHLDRQPRLTFYFMNYFIHNLILNYKPDLKNIYLSVAKKRNNKNAIKFYTSIGFKELNNGHMKYTFTKGGKKIKKTLRKCKNTLRKNTRKHKR